MSDRRLELIKISTAFLEKKYEHQMVQYKINKTRRLPKVPTKNDIQKIAQGFEDFIFDRGHKFKSY